MVKNCEKSMVNDGEQQGKTMGNDGKQLKTMKNYEKQLKKEKL
jgi:hypothetical protein